jgi:hypothetical protein
MEDFKVRPHEDEEEEKHSYFMWLVLAAILLLGLIIFWAYYQRSLAVIEEFNQADIFLNLEKINELPLK